MPYDPNQPRVPAGNKNGGEWTDEQLDTIESAARKAAGLVRQDSPGGRAAGGVTTIGMNQLIYRGGQFLPSTELDKLAKAEKKYAKNYMETKQEIAPYKWETPPSPTSTAVFKTLSGVVPYNRDSDTFDVSGVSEKTIKYYGGESFLEKLLSAASLYNSGIRWRAMTSEELAWRQQKIEKAAGINK